MQAGERCGEGLGREVGRGLGVPCAGEQEAGQRPRVPAVERGEGGGISACRAQQLVVAAFVHVLTCHGTPGL
jgi:hypothetical protein